MQHTTIRLARMVVTLLGDTGAFKGQSCNTYFKLFIWKSGYSMCHKTAPLLSNDWSIIAAGFKKAERSSGSQNKREMENYSELMGWP